MYLDEEDERAAPGGVRAWVWIAASVVLVCLALLALGSTLLLATEPQSATAEDIHNAIADAADDDSIVILISFDAFRWDYLRAQNTSSIHPNIDRLAAQGVMQRLTPSHPSETFPNHYSIVTGLYTESHGIVSNFIYDPGMDATFSLSDKRAVQDARWWNAGEPLWVTLERLGKTTACMFWPGSEAEIRGFYPSHWFEYDEAFPYTERVRQVIKWLDMPKETRPSFITLYFDAVDTMGHRTGPWSDDVMAAIQTVDVHLGTLLDAIDDPARAHIADKITIILVSDHGMTEISPQRVIYLEELIDLEVLEQTFISPNSNLWVKEEYVDEVYNTLVGVEHLRVYRKEEIPEALHYRHSDRIAPIVAFAEEGWLLMTRSAVISHPNWVTGGTHGYERSLQTMAAIFVANGPSFKKGVVVEDPMDNVHIHGMMANALNITAAALPPTNSSLAAYAHLLQATPRNGDTK